MGEEESGWKGTGKKERIGKADREGRPGEGAKEREHRAIVLKGGLESGDVGSQGTGWQTRRGSSAPR